MSVHKYRLREGFNHVEWQDGERVKCAAGSVVEMDEARAATLSDRFELVVVDDSPSPTSAEKPKKKAPPKKSAEKKEGDEAGGSADEGESPDWPAILSTHNVGQVRTLLADVDDVAVLEAIGAVEAAREGGPRAGVRRALENRRKALSG